PCPWWWRSRSPRSTSRIGARCATSSRRTVTGTRSPCGASAFRRLPAPRRRRNPREVWHHEVVSPSVTALHPLRRPSTAATRARRRHPPAHFLFELRLAGRELLTERHQVHVRLACRREHAARLLFFLDVMFDHLRQHGHLGV